MFEANGKCNAASITPKHFSNYLSIIIFGEQTFKHQVNISLQDLKSV